MREKMYKLFHPSNGVAMFDAIIIAISMAYLIIFKKFDTWIGYILYLLMSFLFIVICIKIYDIMRYLIDLISKKNRYVKMYREDYVLRYQISLFCSLSLNIIYALFKLISGIIFKSLWLIAFAIYYFLLVILRIIIAKTEFKKDKTIMDEYLCYRKVGVILLFTNLFIMVVILIIVNGNTLKSYNDIIAIAVATYTFYLMIRNIRTLVKYHKYQNYLMNSAKIINVVTSLISLLSLEIIMLSTFSLEKTEFNKIMIMATGGTISLVIIGISLYMIIQGTEHICPK